MTKYLDENGLAEFAGKVKEKMLFIGDSSAGSGYDIDSFGSYSLNEIETPFTWIDGKTIYKKTFQNHFSGSGDKIVFTFSNIKIIKVEGFIDPLTSSAVGRMVPTMYGSPVVINSYYTWDAEDLTFKAISDFFDYDVYTTVYYTKS